MNEKTFNLELKKSLIFHGAWAHKIADMPRGPMLRFNPEKPCDIVGVFKGQMFVIESKQIKKFQAFGIEALRPGQISSLTKIHEAGGKAFVFLNVRIPRTINSILVFEWEFWKWRWQTLGSLKKDEIEVMTFKEGLKAQRVNKDLIFDLEEFLASVAPIKGKTE